jgi:hypothetical protein
VKREFLGRLRPAGEGLLAELHKLAASENAVRVDVGRFGGRLA